MRKSTTKMLSYLSDTELVHRTRLAEEIIRTVDEEVERLEQRHARQLASIQRRRGNSLKAIDQLKSEALRRYVAEKNVLANKGLAPEAYETECRALAERLGV